MPLSRTFRLKPSRTAITTLATSLAVVLATAGVSWSGVGSPGAPGIGDPYFPTYGNGGYDVDKYRVDNQYRPVSGELWGRTVIHADATQDLSSFNVDFVLRVESVTVDGQDAAFTRPNKHEVKVTPASPIPNGQPFAVAVRYHGYPARVDAAGVRSPWIKNRSETVAMGEPEIAAWWFPGNDHPRDKALFDVTITVPAGNDVISNGWLDGRGSARGGRLGYWHWKTSEPMAPYLAFFAVGSFRIDRESSRGVPYTYAVSRQLPPRQRDKAMKFLKQSPMVTHWLSRTFGQYPFSQNGGLVFNVSAGFAMETQTRPSYPYVGAHRAGLVVHELAHQWFGDVVSVNRWRDIWLNEGFASYAEWAWHEHKGRMTTAQRLQEFYQTYRRSDWFWNLTIGNPGKHHLFDWSVYKRGAMTLAALRERVGDADFDTIMQTWVADHSGGDATVEDFISLAETVSSENLDGFFDAWLYTPERPAKTAANGLNF